MMAVVIGDSNKNNNAQLITHSLSKLNCQNDKGRKQMIFKEQRPTNRATTTTTTTTATAIAIATIANTKHNNKDLTYNYLLYVCKTTGH